MKYSLAVAQISAGTCLEHNYAIVKNLAFQAQAKGCQALCLPEACLTGYDPARVAERSLETNSPYLERLSRLVQGLGMDLLVGFQEREGESYYLTQALFLANGQRKYYRKTHLGARESKFFTPGTLLPVYELSCGLKIGIALCVECHFPELVQTLALDGAELVFAPHAVPSRAGSRQMVWSRYINTRSYDNRLYMACCNLWDGVSYGGGCLVTGPDGAEISSCYSSGERLLTFAVDQDLITMYRKNASMGSRFYPVLRRRDLYR